MHLEQVGNYRLLRSVGKGGMGEVFLAYDPICEREVALKLLRSEWVGKQGMQARFLKEAKIAAQLSHPSIIPIYSIHENAGGSFYTMPHIEGETLKAILRSPLHPTRASIPSLMRIFLNICSAIAYAHARQIVHRDLKPENIIIGKYGEVILLDWGLAEHLSEAKPQEQGIPGTIAYMAPELAFGEGASIQTDIYALGVILYQLLSLTLPFHRTTIKEFRKTFGKETWIDPQEIAPERDITLLLSEMAKKCLDVRKEERYSSVELLINDVQRYIDGLPEWKEAALLRIDSKEDWEFQENVVLGKHMAINREGDLLQWVNLMIARRSFPGNVRMECTVDLEPHCKGLALLFGLPEQLPKSPLSEGYCLWLGADCRLYRSGVEVWRDASHSFTEKRRRHLVIEKIDNQIDFYLDGIPHMRFQGHLPHLGTRIGLILLDGELKSSPLKVSIGSQQAMINCLAVPDAFLARKHYSDALFEYRKIAGSFLGRAEGREAIFRAGLTLLEEAKSAKQKAPRELLLSKALEEFEKLHGSPGAPLEYVGKARVYQTTGEIEEEAKCLELSLRRFSKHPLHAHVSEHLISRLFESAQSNRQAAFHLSFLALRYLPEFVSSPTGQELLGLLEKHLEPFPFFVETSRREVSLSLQLAFWLGRPLAIREMIDQGLDPAEKQNAYLALIQLRRPDLVKRDDQCPIELLWLLGEAPLLPSYSAEVRLANFEEYLLDPTGDFSYLKRDPSTPLLDTYTIWALLLESRFEEAEELISTLPSELTQRETHPLFFIRGCLWMAQGRQEEALSHLLSISESASPPTSALLSHYLLGRIAPTGKWAKRAFHWEKVKLLQQMQLFAHCTGQKKPVLRAQLNQLNHSLSVEK